MVLEVPFENVLVAHRMVVFTTLKNEIVRAASPVKSKHSSLSASVKTSFGTLLRRLAGTGPAH